MEENIVVPEKKKTNKKKVILVSAISAGVLVLGLGGFFLTNTLIMPSIKYEKAVKMLEEGNYAEAQEAFQEIIDYKDSSDRYKMARYGEAIALIESGNYEEGYDILSSLGHFNGADEQILSSYYTRAESIYADYIESGDISTLSDAIDYYVSADGYADSSDKVVECQNIIAYSEAQALLDSGDYSAAVNAFQALGSFNDAQDKAHEAMYEYCTHHRSSSDSTTASYINTLENCNYPGISSLISSIYHVDANIDRVNNSAYDNTNDYSWHYEYEHIYYHVSVSGLRPGTTCTLYYEIEWGDGSSDTGNWTNVSNGDDLVLNSNPYHCAPYETFRVYDSSWNLLDSVTVTVYEY